MKMNVHIVLPFSVTVATLALAVGLISSPEIPTAHLLIRPDPNVVLLYACRVDVVVGFSAYGSLTCKFLSRFFNEIPLQFLRLIHADACQSFRRYMVVVGNFAQLWACFPVKEMV